MEDSMEIKESRFGKGLFAKKKITAGTVLCSIPLGKELNFDKSVQLKDKESHALQIDFDRYILCVPPFLYSNHSCNPNCGINPAFEMIALRDIRAGEELFWDYSTSMLERHWTMKCACGEKNCRKNITDFDLLPQKIQSKYLELNIVFPFIAHFLQQQLAKSA
jgi:SET domain-containing protein